MAPSLKEETKGNSAVVKNEANVELEHLEALKESGNNLFRKGDVAGAADLYSRCGEGCRRLLNQIQSKEGETSVKALLSNALCNRSLCRIRQDRFSEAEEDSRAALDLTPHYCKALYRHAVACFRLGDNSKVLSDLNLLLTIDPRNAEAVALFAKVRNSALEATERRMEETLPLSLVEKLMEESCDCASRIEALRKLTNFVGSKRLHESALRQDLLSRIFEILRSTCDESKEVETPLEAALWSSVCCLVSYSPLRPADGEETEESSASERVAKVAKGLPLDIPEGVLYARRVMALSIPSKTALRTFRKFVRQGVTDPDVTVDCEVTKFILLKPNFLRGIAARSIVTSVGMIAQSNAGNFESDASFLDLCADAIECRESVSIQLAGVSALCLALNARRILGLKAPALRLRHGLEKCLEASIDALADTLEVEGERSRRMKGLVETLVSGAVSLLADKEKPASETVDLSRLFEKLLAPFLFKKQSSLEGDAVGFEVLKYFFTGDREATRQFFSTQNLTPRVMQAATGRSECALGLAVTSSLQRQMQSAAAEVLLHCLEFPELRNQLLKDDALAKLAEIARNKELAPLLRARFAVALARLSVHSSEVLECVFEQVDFAGLLSGMFDEVLKKKQKHASESAEAKCSEVEQLGLWALEAFYFLSLHSRFKKALLQKGPSSSSASETDDLLGRFLSVASEVFSSARKGGGPTCFLVCSALRNLTLSRDDKQKLRSGASKGRPMPSVDLDESQLRELEALFEKLPEEARPLQNGKVDMGDESDAYLLRLALIEKGAVKLLTRGCAAFTKSVAPSDLTLEACVETLAKLTQNPSAKTRSRLVQDGALATTMKLVELLESRHSETQREARQTAAQLFLSVHPKLIPHHLAVGLVSVLLPLLEDNHELLQYEGALALTNLASLEGEVCERLFSLGGWDRFRELLFSDNPMLRASGVEGLLNLACSEKVQNAIADRAERHQQQLLDLRLLLAFSLCYENSRAQEAAIAALAKLTLSAKIAQLLPSYDEYKNLFQVLDECTRDNQRIIERVISCMFHVASWQIGSKESDRIVQAIRKNKHKFMDASLETYESFVEVLNLEEKRPPPPSPE